MLYMKEINGAVNELLATGRVPNFSRSKYLQISLLLFQPFYDFERPLVLIVIFTEMLFFVWMSKCIYIFFW